MATNGGGGSRSPSGSGGGWSDAALSYGSSGSRRSKQSTRKRVARGAVSGAATGAAVGSVVPGVGTAAGAGAGAALGGTSAAVSTEGRDPRTGAKRLLVAEFIVCIVILALSPITKTEDVSRKAAAAWMKKGSAMCGLFLILGMVSGAGPKAAKAAAGMGGIITLALLIDQRSIFGVIAKKFGTQSTAADLGAQVGDRIGPPSDDSVAGGLGSSAGDQVAGQLGIPRAPGITSADAAERWAT